MAVRARLIAVLAVVLAMCAGPSEVAAAVSTTAPDGPDRAEGRVVGTRAPAGSRSVTLVTGDRVTISPGDRQPLIERGEGRDRVSFVARWRLGHLFVLPSDAMELVESGRLDRRLFDVTALLDSGYDDAMRADLPMIVQYDQPVAGRRLRTAGVTGQRELPIIQGLAVRQAKRDVVRFWTSMTRPSGAGSTGRPTAPKQLGTGIARVWLDARHKPTLDRSVPQIGAPTAWRSGFTGAGVTVAVLDSGIDTGHPDLAGKVTATRNFTAEGDQDEDGHGTHVASTVAGSGAAAGGRLRGVAPDARLLGGKVCGVEFCEESAILAGMTWAVEEQGARIVNLSLGDFDTREDDPLEQAINRFSAQNGTLFVVSAGNAGPQPGSISTPASADAALAVGAVDRAGEATSFSSRGPRTGDAAVKPDLTAPGDGIVAARGSGTSMGEPVDDNYTASSGTSMAAPHVAGAAAILLQRHPDWTGEQLKAALMSSAAPSQGVSAFTQGAGLVDVARAVDQPVTSSPATMSLGLQRWPHGDDEPVSRTVTYRNRGANPVSLDLAIQATGPEGAAAPVGMFDVKPATVTVPAGGAATVTVTGDTAVTAATGQTGDFGGQLVATGGSVRLSTPVGISAEDESYDLTIRHLGRDGAPAGAHQTVISELRTACTVCDLPVSGDSGTERVRLPAGDYHLDSTISTTGAGDENRLVRPNLRLDRDTTAVLDARAAKPIDITVPQPKAALVTFLMLYTRTWADPDENSVVFDWKPTVPLADFRTANIGPAVPDGALATRAYASFAVPGPEGDFVDSPDVTNLVWWVSGRVFTGLSRQVRAEDLATVRSTYLGTAPRAQGRRNVGAWRQDGEHGIYADEQPTFRLPFTRTERYLIAGNRWDGVFEQRGLDDQRLHYIAESMPRAYQPGRTYTERWGDGVLGPRFADPLSPVDQGVVRRGNEISARIPLYSDNDPTHWSNPRLGTPGRTDLYRDGTLVATLPSCCSVSSGDLPPKPAAYRLDAEGDFSFSTSSTKVTGSWTFTSAQVGGDTFTALPLMSVRYNPNLDDQHRAPAGQPFDLPVTVERQPGAAPADVASLTVEVSYDDGVTWRQAPLRATSTGWSARVQHPAQGFVSLRATATDSAGNSTKQTIIRAYALRAT